MHKLSRDNFFGYIEEKTICESSTGPRTLGGAFEITSRQDETVVMYRNIYYTVETRPPTNGEDDIGGYHLGEQIYEKP